RIDPAGAELSLTIRSFDRNTGSLCIVDCLRSPGARAASIFRVHIPPRRGIHPPYTFTLESSAFPFRVTHEADVRHEAAQVFLSLIKKAVVSPAEPGLVAPVSADSLRGATAHAVAPESAPLATAVLLGDQRQYLVADAAKTPLVAVPLLQPGVYVPMLARLKTGRRRAVAQHDRLGIRVEIQARSKNTRPLLQTEDRGNSIFKGLPVQAIVFYLAPPEKFTPCI